MHMHHIVICGLSGSTIFSFPHHLIRNKILEKEVADMNETCFDFLHKFKWNISDLKKNWARYDKKMYIGLQVPVIRARL
jgi:hypothetical protein